MQARGILPGDWIPEMQEPDYIELDTWESPGFRDLVDAIGKGYTDGAGGPKTIPFSILFPFEIRW